MKILMVCLGNICRSPIAEGLLKKKLLEAKINNVIIDSCGFEKYHLGDPPDKRAIEVCINNGVDISAKRQRLFKAEDFDIFDKIYVMDLNNMKDVKKASRNEDDLQKVSFILNECNSKKNLHVPDPYYGRMTDFEKVFELLDMACDGIVEKIKNEQY